MVEKIKQAAIIYNNNYLNSLPTDEQLNELELSQRFEKRMSRLINRQSKFYYPVINTALKRVASIAFVGICALSVVSALTFFTKSQNVRVHYQNYYVEYSKNGDGFVFEDFDQKELDKVPEQLIEKTPQYIPEGYAIDNEYLGSIGTNYSTKIYKHENSQKTIKITQYIKKYYFGVNIGTAEVEEITINGCKSLLITEDSRTLIMYPAKDYLFDIEGDITPKELIKIAESIK